MIASPAHVAAVQVGQVTLLGSRNVRSAFIKHAVVGRVSVSATGLAGDAQADLRVHGGRDKAVYAYPAAAYEKWRVAAPHHAERLSAGAMGENLTLAGLSDDDVAIGDRVVIGTTMLEVSEPRMPCYKLGLAFDDASMVRTFGAVGVSGWYYRVIEPGTIGVEDPVIRVAQPNPAWTITRFVLAVTKGHIGDDDLVDIAELQGIADGWRVKARRLLVRRAAG